MIIDVIESENVNYIMIIIDEEQFHFSIYYFLIFFIYLLSKFSIFMDKIYLI